MNAERRGTAAPPLLTAADVAERLQLSVWAVRSLLVSGALPAFKPGGRRSGWRVREGDLERFIERRIAEHAGQQNGSEACDSHASGGPESGSETAP